MKFKLFTSGLLLMSLIAIQVPILADGHSGALTLQPRQDPAVMTVTNVQLTNAGGVISAVGDMGEYGKVYTTYHLTRGADGAGGKVTGQGRGVMNNEVATGDFVGHWFREGAIVTMHNIVQINDGSQNLDVITFDAAKNELLIKVYILK